MSTTPFVLSRPLCTDILAGYTPDQREALDALPDHAFTESAEEGGARVLACLVDLAYRVALNQYRSEVSGSTSEVIVARFEGNTVKLDPLLEQMIAHDCALDPTRDAELMQRLMRECRAYLQQHPHKGHYGSLGCNDEGIFADPTYARADYSSMFLDPAEPA